MTKRQNKIESVSSILAKSSFGAGFEKSAAFGDTLSVVLDLKKKWTKIAGSVVAANVSIITVKSGTTLVLGTSSSVWMHELSCLKIQLLAKLKNIFPNSLIKDIKMKLVKKPTIQKKPENSELPLYFLPTQEESKKVDSVLQNVEDESLQQILKRIFIKSSRKKKNVENARVDIDQRRRSK